MNPLSDKIRKHIEANYRLSNSDLLELLENFPDASFCGDAFRVLLFTDFIPENPKLEISNDRSFADNLESIKKYLSYQDLDYYNHCVVFKVSVRKADCLKTIYHIPISEESIL